MKKKSFLFIITFLMCCLAYSQSQNILYKTGMDGVYISDYNSNNSCVIIKSASGYDENYLGGAVRNWTLKIEFSDNIELSFIGFIGAESKRTYSKNMKLSFPINIIEKKESTEITEVTLTGYDSKTNRIFYEAYIESFKGNYAFLSGYFSKEPRNCIFSDDSINKEMTVLENLKLRSAEETSSDVLTIMSAVTKVKVLELGKEETIDGIKSNWVKVEIISGNDRGGNKLKSGMTGWCYGGYLE